MESVAAIVLAAGYSQRMGRFKPLLGLAGRTVIEHALSAFFSAGISNVTVVTGHRAEQLTLELERQNVRCVHNPDYDSGMYSSVVAGISSLPAHIEACMLLPADIPLVRSATVKRIVEQGLGSGKSIVHPVFRGERGHPPLIGRAIFAEILTGKGNGGLRALLARHEDDTLEVEVFDEGILLDMDGPDDYARLQTIAWSRDYPSARECETMLSAFYCDRMLLAHSRAVANVAEILARALRHCGVWQNLDLVRAASLLHDIAKGQPRHAEAGASIVRKMGFPKVAELVSSHMDIAFAGKDPDEAALVYLADKLVQGDRRVSLETRFDKAFAKFCGDAQALEAACRKYATACAIAAAIETRTGLSIQELVGAAPAVSVE